jgi:hypothetical protein
MSNFNCIQGNLPAKNYITILRLCMNSGPSGQLTQIEQNQDKVLQQEQVKVKPGNPGMQSIHPSELI